MIFDPIKQRFGYGAARLAISRPVGGSTLSALARTPTEREEAFAAMLTLLCVGIALLLALTIQLESIDSQPTALIAADLAAPLEMELWSPAEPTPLKEIKFSTALPATPATPATPASPADPIRESDPSDAEAPTPHELDFDASSVAMQGLSSPVPNTHTQDLPIALPRLSPRATNYRTKRPDLFASSFGSPRPGTLDIADELSTAHPRASQRPSATTGREQAPSMANLSRSDNGREFLVARAALEAMGPAAPSPRRVPAVSAAGIASASAMDTVVRDEINRAGYRADWQEVPLDELPDCSPPGRQDLLKKRILLAAPFERECSHQDGSYRFIETRNLGAFLMWSRPNPDRLAGQPRDLNVCDVLERALRCLDKSPIEESIAQ